MKYIVGDLIKLAKEGQFDVIVHGANCFNTMGAGIAKTIKEDFYKAYLADQYTVKGDRTKIGTYTQATINMPETNHKLTVVNAYTQYTYGRGRDLFEYEGFEKILDSLNVEFKGKKIGFPLIGCGLAGGNKERILEMIENQLKEQEVTVVEFIVPQVKFKY